MKIGRENSKKTMLAIGLAVVALILTARMFYSSFSSSAASAPPAAANEAAGPAPAQRPATRRSPRSQQPRPKGASVTASLDPRLNLKLLSETESMQYDGMGRNIFKANAEDPMPVIPKAMGNGLKDDAKKMPPPPPPVYTPPPPPPIPLKFFGFANQQGGKKVLLLSGDDVFVATEGEIVQRRYKIVKINANNIEVMDVLSNNKQTIPLTAG